MKCFAKRNSPSVAEQGFQRWGTQNNESGLEYMISTACEATNVVIALSCRNRIFTSMCFVTSFFQVDLSPLHFDRTIRRPDENELVESDDH